MIDKQAWQIEQPSHPGNHRHNVKSLDPWIERVEHMERTFHIFRVLSLSIIRKKEKDWQKKEAHLPKLSFDQIHNMIWKKSSSIVKWILIISVLEFTLPQLLYLLPSYKDGMEIYENIGIAKYLKVLSGLTYLVAFYFIFQFYKRF